MNTKFSALVLIGILTTGLIYIHPAYAHNFGGDQSATWLAKVAEIKTEINLVAKHVTVKKAIDYYADALDEYWNANDTKEMGERNVLLQKEIPGTINAVIDSAKAGNQSAVNDNVSKLSDYLDESIPVRVDKDKLSNSTVQAMAVVFVLKESLEKYGTAINSTVDLNDMSQMNMNGSMSGGSMSGMSMSSAIVDQNSYDNSIGLVTTAQQMFTDLSAKNLDKADTNNKVSSAFTKLVKDLGTKADVNTVMTDVHENIHPSLISGYKIHEATTAVPEFPFPALLVLVSIAGVIAATRFKPHLGF